MKSKYDLEESNYFPRLYQLPKRRKEKQIRVQEQEQRSLLATFSRQNNWANLEEIGMVYPFSEKL